MAKIWIEAALNGPWTRARQPGIPVAVEDIVADGIAAADAGAAIIHAHAYDVTTGQQKDDWEIYARIIEGIRAKVDVIVYPTIPSPALGQEQTINRFGHTAELAKRGLIEWAVIDPGSVHFARFEDLTHGGIYQNPHADILEGMRISREHNVHPSYAIYEPGFTRLGAALASVSPPSPTPIYRFMFSDEFAWGFPPRPAYLDAHLELLAECALGAPWMIAGLGVDITSLIPHAVAKGGHVRVGLEDINWGSKQTNTALVKDAVRCVRDAGGEPASVAEVRAALKACDSARGRKRV
ncbi:MAG: 3-keto-5-aminohexanoate cleavage protein [Afipia sp.]|nr:3-keto-5-aminohexanoate cleavage protein [Afipia sp.]